MELQDREPPPKVGANLEAPFVGRVTRLQQKSKAILSSGARPSKKAGKVLRGMARDKAKACFDSAVDGPCDPRDDDELLRRSLDRRGGHQALAEVWARVIAPASGLELSGSRCRGRGALDVVASRGSGAGEAKLEPIRRLRRAAHSGRRNLLAQGKESWRPGPESNRGARICSPLRNHSAIRPPRRF